MQLFSRQQMRELEQKTVAQHKISTSTLMEHAGLEVARVAQEILEGVKGKRILTVCGPGNNGGDGLVAARALHEQGAQSAVFLLAAVNALQGDVKSKYDALKKLNPQAFLPQSGFVGSLQRADCVVDAIFGIGLNRSVDEKIADIIQSINKSKKRVIAIDVPSGIDADNGKILGRAVQASITVTLATAKIGLFLYPARACAGKLVIADIGIPPQLIHDSPSTAQVAELAQVAMWIPKWHPETHKGDRGRVMILGGSRGLSGAPALASMAALHSGSGLVYLGIPDGIRTLMESKLTEVIKVGIPQTNSWVFGKPSLPETRMWFEKIDALAIGPGVGRAEETQEFVRTVVQEYKGPLVIDADGLFAINEDFLKEHGRPSMVLTPHEGEMGKLCGLPPEKVREERFALASEKAKEWNVTLVLKGASTLIVSGNSIWINPTGNPGMATAGSGDVLTGMIVSLLGQGLSAERASVAGAFLHGLSGDLVAQEMGVRAITAERLSTSLWKSFLACENPVLGHF